MNNFEETLEFFPQSIKMLFDDIPTNSKELITELRIRREKPLVIIIDNTSYFLSDCCKLVNHISDRAVKITSAQFDEIFGRISSFSVHKYMNTMIEGYITCNNGNRVGITSTAITKDGNIVSVKDVNSLNIRIAKDIKNCARKVLNTLYVNELPSIIVASHPSGGKTTFLRDLSRLLSSGFSGKYRKVTIVDERNEIAAFDVGVNTDVLSSFPKKDGIEIAVRTLSPDIVVCDEIANEDEVERIRFGFSSGIAFAVSVHIKSIDDVFNKSIMKSLILTGEFDYVVILEKFGEEFTVIDLRSLKDEGFGYSDDNSVFNPFGFFEKP